MSDTALREAYRNLLSKVSRRVCRSFFGSLLGLRSLRSRVVCHVAWVPDLSILLNLSSLFGMVTEGGVRAWHICFQDGSLVGTYLAPAGGLELVVGCGAIDAGEGIGVRTDGLCGVRGGASEEVATNERKIGKELAHFRVRGDEGEEGTQMLHG